MSLCPDCGRPISLNPTGWWSHDGMPNGCWRLSMDGPNVEEPSEHERLEYLRSCIRAESISYGEIAELQGLADFIEPGDVELAEWAGIPEEEFAKRGMTT